LGRRILRTQIHNADFLRYHIPVRSKPTSSFLAIASAVLFALLLSDSEGIRLLPFAGSCDPTENHRIGSVPETVRYLENILRFGESKPVERRAPITNEIASSAVEQSVSAAPTAISPSADPSMPRVLQPCGHGRCQPGLSKRGPPMI